MVLQVDEAQLVARFGPFEDSAIFTQDRCTVCSERTIGLEIIVDAPDGTPRWRVHVKSRFGPFGDGVSLSER
jgi:hypothetical protein